MPLPLPAMPTPVLENAKALSEELNVHSSAQPVLRAAHETRRMDILASNPPAVANSVAGPFTYPRPYAISSIEVT